MLSALLSAHRQSALWVSAHSRWVWRVRPILRDNVIDRVRCREQKRADYYVKTVYVDRSSRAAERVTAEWVAAPPPNRFFRVPGRDRDQRVSAASASSRDHRHSHTPTRPVSVWNPPRQGRQRGARHTRRRARPFEQEASYATTSNNALRLTHRLVYSSCDLGGSPPVGSKLHVVVRSEHYH